MICLHLHIKTGFQLMTRHTEINVIINRSLTSIHVNSTLEPNGLSRDDGKCPEWMLPWIKGQPLVWDVTVVDTHADVTY
jgi:hypothetical protein